MMLGKLTPGPLLAATIAVIVSNQALAEPAACRLLPGTYLTTITDIEGVFASRGLVTFLPGGSLIVNDSRQGGQAEVYEPFSTGQGAWSCKSGEDGKPVFEALSLTFTTPHSSAGSRIGHVNYEGEIDTSNGAISGHMSLLLSTSQDLESDDPIVDPGEVLEKFDFVGMRIEMP